MSASICHDFWMVPFCTSLPIPLTALSVAWLGEQCLVEMAKRMCVHLRIPHWPFYDSESTFRIEKHLTIWILLANQNTVLAECMCLITGTLCIITMHSHVLIEALSSSCSLNLADIFVWSNKGTWGTCLGCMLGSNNSCGAMSICWLFCHRFSWHVLSRTSVVVYKCGLLCKDFVISGSPSVDTQHLCLVQ